MRTKDRVPGVVSPRTALGESLRGAAAGPLSPAVAVDLLRRAADAVDELSGALGRLRQTADEQAVVIAELKQALEIANAAIETKDAITETLRRHVAELQGELSKAPEAMGEILDAVGRPQTRAEAEANLCEGADNPE